MLHGEKRRRAEIGSARKRRPDAEKNATHNGKRRGVADKDGLLHGVSVKRIVRKTLNVNVDSEKIRRNRNRLVEFISKRHSPKHAVLLTQDDKVLVKDTVTKAMMDALKEDGATQPTLTFTAYACQKDGVPDVAAAWEIVSQSQK